MDAVKERAKTVSNRLKNASTLAAASLPNLPGPTLFLTNDENEYGWHYGDGFGI